MKTINVIEIKLFPEISNEINITNLIAYGNSVNGNINAKNDFKTLLKHYDVNMEESKINEYSNIGFYVSNDGRYQLAIADSLPLQFLL